MRQTNIEFNFFLLDPDFFPPQIGIMTQKTKEKHTSVVRVSIDYIQVGNFGKSWFPKASFGCWAAVRQHVIYSMYCQSLLSQTSSDRHSMSYISFWRTGQGLYSESDPPSLCLLKPLVSPESKWEKSQKSCCWNNETRTKTTQNRGHLCKEYIWFHLFYNGNNKKKSSTKTTIRAKEDSTQLILDYGLLGCPVGVRR